MKNSIKMLITPTMLVILCFCSISLPAFAATKSHEYKSILEFKGEHQGATRNYKYKNIKFSATAKSYIGSTEIPSSNTYYSKTYTVSLYRDNGLFSKEKIASKKLSRYSADSAKWTNIGKGNYYFYFTKARDGVTVKSKNVVMKSYQ